MEGTIFTHTRTSTVIQNIDHARDLEAVEKKVIGGEKNRCVDETLIDSNRGIYQRIQCAVRL
jgi:hypothetical protein